MINTRAPLYGLNLSQKTFLPLKQGSLSTGNSSILSPLALDKVEFSQPRFSGRTMQDDQNAQVQLENEMDQLGMKIEKVSKNTKKGATIGGGLGGGFGFIGSLMTFAADGFTLTGGGAAGGGTAGAGAARWYSKKKYGDPDYNRGLIQEKQNAYAEFENWLAEGEAHLDSMEGLQEKAKTAVDAQVFQDDEIHSLKHGLHDARYDEVRDKANHLKPEAGKIPGFIERFTKLTERQWSGHPVKDLESDLETGNSQVQALALRRYYPIEQGRTGNAPKLYKGFLSHENSDVAATALRMMNEHPVLRGDSKDYTKVLEKFLDSGNPKKIDAALDGIMASNQKSNTINLMLERISHPNSPYSPNLRKKALDANSHRFAQGVNKTINPQESAARLLASMVGNDAMRPKLIKAIKEYQGALKVAGNDSPALTLYLPGEAGIGKTTILQRLQNELHGDPDGLKIIEMGTLRNGDDLLDRLREHQPLQGKTILLDEFHNLDNEELNRGRQGIIQILKDLFATEDDTNTGVHPMMAKHGIDVKDTILGVATNKPLPKMTSMSDEAGKPVKSRLLSQATRLELEDNLDNHLMELLDGFEAHRFYGKVKDRRFEGPIHLSEQAKEVLLRELPPEAEASDEHSGRFYVNQIVKQLNSAIDEGESSSGYHFIRDRQGKVTEPLEISVNEDGFLVAKQKR